MRGEKPFVFTNLIRGDGLQEVINFIVERGMLEKRDVKVEVTEA